MKVVRSRETSAPGSSNVLKEHGELLSVLTTRDILVLFENLRNGYAWAIGTLDKCISIESPSFTQWIPAFAEWFCGAPVTVYLRGDSKTASLRVDL